jgi:DNA-binding MarR family transcriptional regulator
MNGVIKLSESDLVIELVETLHGLRSFKGWYRGDPLPVRKNALVLLMFLHHHLSEESPGLQPSELGELLKLTRPTVTTLVNSLEEHGLVERTNDDEDRRVVFVRPTEQGLALVTQAKQAFARSIEEIMDHLGPEDAKELVRIARRVRRFLENRQGDVDGGGA